MNLKKLLIAGCALGIFFVTPASHADREFVLSRDELLPLKDPKAPTLSAKEHFASLEKAFQDKKWSEVIKHGSVIFEHFSEEPFADLSHYYVGLSFFHKKKYVRANREFSRYLSAEAPEHFQEALRYKFDIAQNFARGKTGDYPVVKRLFSERSFKERAIEIFDEILLAEPSGDLAAYSLYHKGLVLLNMGLYDESVAVFETTIREFFKHELVPKAYVGIAKSYEARYRQEKSKDIAILNLATISCAKFEREYPGHELIGEVKKELQSMREGYSWEMYEVGRYFERRKKPKAAGFYYRDICNNFPDTEAATLCHEKHAPLLKEDTSPNA